MQQICCRSSSGSDPATPNHARIGVNRSTCLTFTSKGERVHVRGAGGDAPPRQCPILEGRGGRRHLGPEEPPQHARATTQRKIPNSNNAKIIHNPRASPYVTKPLSRQAKRCSETALSIINVTRGAGPLPAPRASSMPPCLRFARMSPGLPPVQSVCSPCCTP